jgi:hypothetical protein
VGAALEALRAARQARSASQPKAPVRRGRTSARPPALDELVTPAVVQAFAAAGVDVSRETIAELAWQGAARGALIAIAAEYAVNARRLAMRSLDPAAEAWIASQQEKRARWYARIAEVLGIDVDEIPGRAAIVAGMRARPAIAVVPE